MQYRGPQHLCRYGMKNEFEVQWGRKFEYCESKEIDHETLRTYPLAVPCPLHAIRLRWMNLSCILNPLYARSLKVPEYVTDALFVRDFEYRWGCAEDAFLDEEDALPYLMIP